MQWKISKTTTEINETKGMRLNISFPYFFISEVIIMTKKSDNQINFEIDHMIGNLKPDNSSGWNKGVGFISWNENTPTLDIRNMNIEKNIMGKGISLSNEEADELVDLLLKNDYGSIEAIEEALEKRKSFFTISDKIGFDKKDEPEKLIIDVG